MTDRITIPCPGGFGCTCCWPECDCGCIEDCPVARWNQQMKTKRLLTHDTRPAEPGVDPDSG